MLCAGGSVELVLVGCGDLAFEIAGYIASENDRQRTAVDITVTDIVSESFIRAGDISDLLGYSPELNSNFEELGRIASKEFLICSGDASTRRSIQERLNPISPRYHTFVHSTAYVSESATIGPGTIIAPFAFIGSNATLGRNCLLNVRSTIGHDVIVGEGAVIGPGASLNGHVFCDTASFISSGVIIDPFVKVGRNCKVASGSVVKADVPDGYLVSGNPATGRQMFKITPE